MDKELIDQLIAQARLTGASEFTYWAVKKVCGMKNDTFLEIAQIISELSLAYQKEKQNEMGTTIV